SGIRKNSASWRIPGAGAEFARIPHRGEYRSGIRKNSATPPLPRAILMPPEYAAFHAHSCLRRAPPACYRRQPYVHGSMTMQDRTTGWLIPTFYYKFREILTHTAFRYGFCCPIYCCMPDHLHLLWVGIIDACDQRRAARYFRRQLNPILEKLCARFQKQPYD